MNSFPKILSMGDVMRELGISQSRVSELIRKKQLRYQETTAGKVFLESDVLALKLERQKRARKDPRIKRGR